jgi:hypothetical protein
MSKGKVQLGKQIHFRAPKHLDKSYPRLEGYTTVSVCSGGGKLGKSLSPFSLGPVTALETCDIDLPECLIFENFWQNLKVFSMELDEKNNPLPVYYSRRLKGFKDPKPHRRVYPKKILEKAKAKCEYSFWQRQKLSWVQARIKIYCPIYSELVQKTSAFKELKERKKNGENLLLIGYDGFDFNPPEDKEELLRIARKHLVDETKTVGHEFVLICLLLDIQPWIGI